MKTIWVHPGYVADKYKSDVHYISAEELASLYHIDLQQENVRIYNKTNITHKYGIRFEEGDIHLHPRYDGVYYNANI